jgi:hypothetical protein
MTEDTIDTITDDERRCLRMWFRQAIAQLEQEEVTSQIYAEHYADDKGKHRAHAPRRKTTRRTQIVPHLRELAY